MKSCQSHMIVICCALLISGCALAKTKSSSNYIYKADLRCRMEPSDPLYGGGMVINPTIDSGLEGWKAYGNSSITTRKSTSGNTYLVAYNRSAPISGFSQSFDVKEDYLYTFSAWLQVGEGEETVLAYIRTPALELKTTNHTKEYMAAGSVVAKSGCWSMLKGGFTTYYDTKVDLVFRCTNNKTEVWIDSVSLKNFTKKEWRNQQEKNINKLRKREIKIKVMNEQGQALEGANISLTQTRPLFTIGGGTGKSILSYKGYQDFFTSRFTAATPHNELKWYATEVARGHENYTEGDAMVDFFAKHGISVRGHCVLWDSVNATDDWVRALPPREVLDVSVRHVSSVLSRYRGRVIAWDVMNENMHNSYFESVLGSNASAMFYQIVRALDPNTPLFLNEFNTLEFPKDLKVTPSRYVHKIREIKSFPGNEDMVLHIGLQAHFFSRPNISYIRAAFDVLGATGNPIWLTEFDITRMPTQGEDYEEVMREAFSHPAMEGIIVWGGWKPGACSEECLRIKDSNLPEYCSQMCLIDDNFNIQPIGKIVDKLINEWKTNVNAVTGKDGVFSDRVFHGSYKLTCSHPSLPNPLHTTFNVTKDDGTFDLELTLKSVYA